MLNPFARKEKENEIKAMGRIPPVSGPDFQLPSAILNRD